MKKNLIYLFSLLFIVSLASCVKDDDDDVKEPKLEDFSDYLGDYRGALTQKMGELGNQIKNLNLNVTTVQGKNKLFFKMDNYLPATRAVSEETGLVEVFTESRLEVDAYIKNDECYFEGKDLTFNGLVNVSLMGNIKGEVVMFGGSGLTKSNQKVEFSFTAQLNGGFVHDLTDVVGDYDGMIKVVNGEVTSTIKEVKSTIDTTDKDNQLKVSFDKLNLGGGEKNFEFLVNASVKEGVCIITESSIELEGYKSALLKGEIKTSKEFNLEITALDADGAKVTIAFVPTEEVVDVEYDLTPFVGEYGADALLVLGQDEANLKNLKAIVETTDNKNEVKVTFVGVTFNGTAEDVVYVSAAKVEDGICTFVEKAATRAFSAGVITGSVDSKTKTLDAKATLTFDGVEGNISFNGGEYIPTPDEKYDLTPFVGDYGADMALSLGGDKVELKNVKVIAEPTDNNNEMRLTFVDVLLNGVKENISYVSAVMVKDNVCTFIDKTTTRAVTAGKLTGTINAEAKMLDVKATLVVDGVEASMDFAGGEYIPTPEEKEIDLAPFVGELSGAYSIVGDAVNYPRNYVRIKSKVEKTGNKNEVRVTVTGLDVNYQMFDLSFTTKVALLDAGVLNLADDAEVNFDVPGATDAKLVKFSLSDNKLLNLSIEATNNNGGTLKMSYEGTEPQSESVVEVAQFVDAYTGDLLGNADYVVKVLAGNRVNELKVQLDQVDFGAGKEDITLTFHVLKEGNGVKLERAYRVESGKPFVTFEGSISADKVLNLSWTVADNAKVDFVGVVKKDPVKVVKEVAYFNFDTWTKAPNGNYLLPNGYPPFSWNSGDEGIETLQPTAYSITPVELSSSNKAVMARTYFAKEIGTTLVSFAPPITAGSLFFGTFKVDISKPAKSIKFGMDYDKKIVKVTGEYKYKAGNKFYRSKKGSGLFGKWSYSEDKNTSDEFAISAVIYEYNNGDTLLDGTNIYESDKIVAKKILSGGDQLEMTPFELELDFIKEYDPAKQYKFTFIISSSKEGAEFHGAPGSELVVDNVRFFAEVEE